MDDREMLELAAKAIGLTLEWDGPPNQWQPMYYKGKTYHSFDPLTDDGDALRLAVKLDIGVEKTNDLKYPKSKTKWCTVTAETQDGFKAVEYEHPDPYTATRRAIVRAAAEIGKMKGEK